MSGPSPDDFEGSDVSGLAALYALDALEGADLERFEAYLATDPSAADEVAEFRDTAGRLAAISSRPAPASIRESVLGSLGDVRQEPPRLDVERRRRQAASRRVASIAAALLLVVGVGVGGFALGSSGDDAPVDEVAMVLSNEDAAVINMTGDGDVSARLVWSASAGRAVVVGEDLEPVDDSSTYELWQIRGEEAVPVGLFRPDEDGVVETAVDVDLVGASAVAVTVEPEGGSDVPTLPLVMSGELA